MLKKRDSQIGPVLAWSVFSVMTVATVARAEPVPTICNGYRPDAREWGSGAEAVKADFVCPPGFAVMGTERYEFRRAWALNGAFAHLDCCPLPAGVLSDRHHFDAPGCPPNSVVTGYRSRSAAAGMTEQDFRCTDLAPGYSLAEAQPGRAYGVLLHSLLDIMRGDSGSALTRGQLSPSLRYGIGRVSRFDWLPEGCVGPSDRALLVAKGTGECESLLFAGIRVSRSGETNNGAAAIANEPMKLFQSCDALADPFEPAPVCIPPR